MDVIVVGGGHAGCEAALAAARMGVRTLLVSGTLDTIGLMPCNPAIGGPAKGQIVREIDALGGEMARCIDHTYLHTRWLNESRGPAVRTLRAQADKRAYAQRMKATLEAQGGLSLRQGVVVDILSHAGAVRGVRLASGTEYAAAQIVIATGTFLGGKMYAGERSVAGGRAGEQASLSLGAALQRIGLELRRLKTGTPPRVHRDSLDLDAMQEQAPSSVPLMFSYESTAAFPGPQLSCYISATSQQTHEIIRRNLHRSPMYGLQLIAGVGPRYCPSIEDKVMKFAHNPSHQVFIEPEGWHTREMYVGGLSTSLPEEVQLELLRTLPGMEHVEMMRAGYAVEYDFADPTQLWPTLETKVMAGLFHAGQINGTSGYEEAAGQGIVAGINAARRAQSRPPVSMPRSASYIGTMIDDLVTKGTAEPYRMLTSRAEHRLILRHDNADERLTPLGREIGLVDDERFSNFQVRMQRLGAEGERLAQSRVKGDDALRLGVEPGITLAEALRRPEIGYADIAGDIEDELGARLEIAIKYEGYIRRQVANVERMSKLDSVAIPDAFAFKHCRALSREAKEKFEAQRPRTLGQAGRIPGVTPADVAVLSVYIHREVNAGALGE